MPNEFNSPEGATANPQIEEDCRRPFGAVGCFETDDLGLTPQATCLCPLRGKISPPGPPSRTFRRNPLRRGKPPGEREETCYQVWHSRE